MSDNYSIQKLKSIRKAPKPRVLLNVCTHGNERVGLKVAKYFSKVNVEKGTFVLNIANEKAMTMRKRFVDVDLNRVFPGKKNGNHEERLAYRMTHFIREFDFVIDVHSTETSVASTLIITKYDVSLKPLLKAIAPKKVIYMSVSKSTSLIAQAKRGVAFEYGKDKDPKTFKDTVDGIERALVHLGMLSLEKEPHKKQNIDLFEAYEVFPRPEGFEVNKEIKNFIEVPKGFLVAKNKETKEKIVANKSFYPVLFVNNTYKSIFGFMARRRSFR